MSVTAEPAVVAGPLTQGIVISSITNKGGVSKTPLMRWLTQAFLERELWLPEKQRGRLTIVDGDGSTGSLSKFYSAQDIVKLSFHSGRYGIDKLITECLRDNADRVIIDLPAASLSRFSEMSEEYNFVDALARTGYRLVLLCPIFPDDETLFDLRDVISLFDPELFAAFHTNDCERKPSAHAARVSYIACVNLNAPCVEDRDDFEDWDSLEDVTGEAPWASTRRLLKYVGGREIVIPKLRAKVQRQLSKRRLSFRAGQEDPRMEWPDQSRLKNWNTQMDRSLESIKDVIGY